MRFLLIFLMASFSAYADKVIHCVTNFQIDDAGYTKILKDRGYDARVVSVDISTYGKDLQIGKGRLNKLFREWGITSLFQVKVDDDVEKIVFF